MLYTLGKTLIKFFAYDSMLSNLDEINIGGFLKGKIKFYIELQKHHKHEKVFFGP